MLYTEYFTLRDCSGFLQFRSHLVWLIGQGFPKTLPQCPLKNNIGDDFSLAMTLVWRLKNNLPNCKIEITIKSTSK